MFNEINNFSNLTNKDQFKGKKDEVESSGSSINSEKNKVTN